jgi:hypothetical protein
MFRFGRLRIFVGLMALICLSVGPGLRSAQETDDRGGNGHAGMNPCKADPPGKAKGLDEKCPDSGSSNGVARGDFNGDGFADLAIGEPGATIGGQAGAGDVIVLPGSANGVTTTGRLLFYEGRVPGTGPAAAGDGFGSALASGDFNGDGYSDLAIGIPRRDVVFQSNVYTNWGSVVVLSGSSSGLTTSGAKVFDLHQHYSLRDGHAAEGARLGQALSWGDFDGDGVGDLAIGAPSFTLDRGLFNSQKSAAGAVWVLYGVKKTSTTAGGLATGSSLLFQGDDVVGVSAGSDDSEPGDHFGANLASGDFNGDGRFDLAIGAPGKTNQVCVLFICSLVHPGILVYELAGTSAGIALTLKGEQYAGYSPGNLALAGGDFDGDGKADLAVGDPGSPDDGGSVAIYYGTSGTAILASTKYENKVQRWDQEVLGRFWDLDDAFGAALAAGDFNADGYADLAIGAPHKSVFVNGATVENAGEVAVIYGGFAGLRLANPPDFINRTDSVFGTALSPIAKNDNFGAPLTAWNFGRDECCRAGPSGLRFPIRTADLAVGVPFKTVNGVSEAGAVHVLYGSAEFNGLPGEQFGGAEERIQIFTADSIGLGGLAGAHFGAGLY